MEKYYVDVASLCITDTSVVSGPKRSEESLHAAATEGVKKLLAEALALPKTTKKGKFEGRQELVQLPQPLIQLPREKAPPKPKPLTNWQKFALKKGIDIHKKKQNKVFDEDRQVWQDKYGKRAKEHREKYDWLREVKPGYVAKEDGGDPFLDDRREKKVKLDKEKANMERNKRRAGMVEQAQKEVAHLNAAVRKLSTASNGKFEVNKIKRSKGKK